jgi:cytochrome P450
VALGPAGPWLATTPAQARTVLTDVERFDFPGDVSRTGDLSGSRGETRSGHVLFSALTPSQVAAGSDIFAVEWTAALAEHDRVRRGEPYDAMVLLRDPVARSTTAAVLPDLKGVEQERVAHAALSWIDALGPVIASRRPPSRWSRKRRAERAARVALEETLDELGSLDRPAPYIATMLAAGIQVPIAAGSFLLAWLASRPTGDIVPAHAVWETLRLTPPTWITPRITTREVDLDGTVIPGGRVVFVSPLLLGRLADLVPGDAAGMSTFEPDRWRDDTQRPGAWLPFGAGPHACPGRNLGMAQLVHLAEWASSQEITLSETVTIDQSRGIAPSPCRFTIVSRGGPAHE